MITWRLNQIMAERRMSGKGLAEILKTHPNTVYRMRKVERMPSIDGETLDKICEALDCTPNDLIGYATKTNPVTGSLHQPRQVATGAKLAHSSAVAIAASAAVDAAMSAIAPAIRQAAVTAVETVMIEQMPYRPN